MPANDRDLKEIHELLKEDKLNQESAMRLMLVQQQKTRTAVVSGFDKIHTRLDSLEEKHKIILNYQEKYPSLTWLWAHRRLATIMGVILVFLMLYFLLTPITISDIRHALLESLGLPGDFGLGTP